MVRPAIDRLRIVDTKTNTTSDVDAPAGCGLKAAGGGQALFGCGDDTRYGGQKVIPVLLDLATGQTHIPVALNNYLAPAQDQCDFYGDLTAVGANWFGYGCYGNHYSTTRFFNWRNATEAWESDAPDLTDDPNAPGLYVPLCSPIRRKRLSLDESEGVGSNFQSIVADPPFALGSNTRGVGSVLRCGHRRPVLRFRCPYTNCTTSLNAGVLTFTNGRRVNIVALRRNRTFSFTLRSQPAYVLHTGYAVLAITISPAGGIAIYQAHIPSS